MLKDICAKVFRAFEQIHVGMDGLQPASASFPPNEGFNIVQQSTGGMSSVSAIEDWTDKPSDPVVKKAYWAVRCNNNCETLNRTFYNVLVGSGADYVVFGHTSYEAVKISTISYRKIGLTPHHVGTLVEPPFVSKIPPSEDGESYHLFLTSLTDRSVVMAIDCSAAQFGVFGFGGEDDQPFLAEMLFPYLKSLGSNRKLEKCEQGDIYPFIQSKVEACMEIIRRAEDAM